MILQTFKSLQKILVRNMASQEQLINVNGQTINYLKTGHGPTTILCCPGALGTIWSDFKPQITDLDKSQFTIIAWDPPGYGNSRPPLRNFDAKFYENDADAAYNFMTQLGIHKFSLLGWSDGGIMGLILSAKYPAVIDKLVVWGANSYITSEDIEYYRKIRNINDWSEKMRSSLVKLYTEEGLQIMWEKWWDTMNIIHANGGDICKNDLEKIKCPTLILHGDLDPLVPQEHPLYLATNIKGAKLHRFPNGKHNIHLRYSQEFNEIISQFL